MTASPPTVLLTGSTGVIGASLLTALTAHYEVTALVRNRRPEAATTCVHGDVTAEKLGLDSGRYRDLAAGIDVIVHCAGLTSFVSDLTAFDNVNAGGTRRILELAEEAKAPVVLISSAAAAREFPGDDLPAQNMRAYGHSKLRAEELAAQCGQPVAIVRPALLFAAHKGTAVPQHQFPHLLFTALLQGQPASGLPVTPDHWCDILPMESLSDYVTALTEAQLRGDATAPGLHWATAGPARLTAADVERACLDFLRAAGRPLPSSLLAAPGASQLRTHGMARLVQLGFLRPEQPAFPTHLSRLLPTQPTRADVLDALAHNIRRCAPWPA
ncbi:SDR family oxidoreductase [Streptomyces sp. NPDC085929]|uniref:SDR family oxidoreductase n=1 Tax=Streptomyces sp. NPDC085929 TaxID=3365739 RepID=UPI0037D7FDEF